MLRSALFWDFTQCRMVVCYRCFGTTYLSPRVKQSKKIGCPETYLVLLFLETLGGKLISTCLYVYIYKAGYVPVFRRNLQPLPFGCNSSFAFCFKWMWNSIYLSLCVCLALFFQRKNTDWVCEYRVLMGILAPDGEEVTEEWTFITISLHQITWTNQGAGWVRAMCIW